MQSASKRECIRVDGEEAGRYMRDTGQCSSRPDLLSIESNTPAIISPSTVNGAARFSCCCGETTATGDNAFGEYTGCLLTLTVPTLFLSQTVKYLAVL